ncbi:MAG: PepSY domain-containing protein [Reyranella sp.]|nr:PepSY domain-containing protein [Reyranella sp.]
MRLPTAFLAAVLAAPLAVSAAAPVSASDHDRARRAVEEGRILPLREILARAQGAYPGQVIEAELEDEGGIVVYEIKMLTADGRVTKLYYNAATGELLKTKDRSGRR